MKQFRFKATIKVAGVTYSAGDVAGDDELPAGNVESMLRNGQIEPLDAPPPPPLADRQAAEIKRLRALLDAKGDDSRDAEIKSLREQLAAAESKARDLEADAKAATDEAAADGIPELASRQSAKALILGLRAEVEALKAAQVPDPKKPAKK